MNTFYQSLYILALLFINAFLHAQAPLDVTTWYTHSEEYVDLFHRQTNAKIEVDDIVQVIAGDSETFVYNLRVKSQSIDKYIGQEDTLHTFVDEMPYGNLIVNENGWSFRKPESDLTKFLYHFNYEVGDSILIQESNDSYLTIESIDSIMFNDEYKTRWNISGVPIYLLEDIGWNIGIQNTDVWKFIQLIQNQFLTCFESTTDQYSLDLQPWVDVFPDIDISWSGCDNVLSSIDHVPGEVTNIQFFPNPTDCEVTLASNQRLERVELFNVIGKQLATFEDKSNGDQIDLSSYHPGQYILISYENGNRYYHTIVVE